MISYRQADLLDQIASLLYTVEFVFSDKSLRFVGISPDTIDRDMVFLSQYFAIVLSETGFASKTFGVSSLAGAMNVIELIRKKLEMNNRIKVYSTSYTEDVDSADIHFSIEVSPK